MRLLSAGVLLSGCTVTGPGSAEDVFLALGGTWTLDPDSLCDSCSDEVDEIREVFPEVEGVVGLPVIGPTTFTMKGLTAGDTQITVSGLDRGSDVVERYAHVFVRHVNRFDFGHRCEVADPSVDPYVLPPGGELEVAWHMYDTDLNTLLADPEWQTGEIGVSGLDLEHRDLVLEMPDEPGTHAVTSPLFDGTIATFEVHEPGDFDGFEAVMWPDTPLELGQVVRTLQTALLVDGRRVCLDRERRVAEVRTPETCSINGAASVEVEEPDLWISGIAEGTCTVVVTVPDYGYTETLDLEIVPPPV